jgi:hypothetical protein
MLNVAIVGTFAASLEDAIRRNLAIPCEIVVSDEATIISHLAEVDVLVTMMLTHEMTRACHGSDWFRCPAQASTGSIARRCRVGHGWRMSTDTRTELPNT